jgi:hypothetical protein
LHGETLHRPHAQRDLVRDAQEAVAQPHQREQALGFLVDDKFFAVRAQDFEL